MTHRAPLVAAAAGFLGCILAANYATGHWGMVPVGFGLVATAGTFFAGLTFVLRDLIHDLSGRLFVFALIIVGGGLSFVVSPANIALASGVAFLLAETADWLIYGPLRRRGYIRAAVASNVVGSFVDTVVFLAIAGFPVWSSVPGQMLAKLTVTGAVVLVVWGSRAVFRDPVRA